MRLSVIETINFYTPNVITINGGRDSNSRFTIFCEEDDIQLIKEMNIFDRWGNQVFNNTNFLPGQAESGWDGTVDDSYVEQGVYVFTAVLLLANEEEIIISGDLTVLD